MTAASPDATDPVDAAFVDDRELHRRINPKIGWDRFRATVREAEDRGFPRIRTLWGGRYWPAVKAWLDNDNGVRNDGYVGDTQDGPEHFDATEGQEARLQDRPHPAGRHAPALLDRRERRA